MTNIADTGATSTPKKNRWANEPALIKAALVTILGIVLQVLNGTTSINAEIPDIVTAALPVIAGLWIRQSVTPTD